VFFGALLAAAGYHACILRTRWKEAQPMSEVKIVVRDANRDIYATRHGGFVDAMIAALSAEPETIDELEVALERFEAPGRSSFFHWFRPGIDDEPYDAGVVLIDLAARLIACESTYSSPGARGTVPYHDGTMKAEG
jgi:hypothetical protein